MLSIFAHLYALYLVHLKLNRENYKVNTDLHTYYLKGENVSAHGICSKLVHFKRYKQ